MFSNDKQRLYLVCIEVDMKWGYEEHNKLMVSYYFVPDVPFARYVNNKLFCEKEDWCDAHTSQVIKWIFFKRDAYYYYSSSKGIGGWFFEKEADMNWFILRWGYGSSY